MVVECYETAGETLASKKSAKVGGRKISRSICGFRTGQKSRPTSRRSSCKKLRLRCPIYTRKITHELRSNHLANRARSPALVSPHADTFRRRRVRQQDRALPVLQGEAKAFRRLQKQKLRSLEVQMP